MSRFLLFSATILLLFSCNSTQPLGSSPLPYLKSGDKYTYKVTQNTKTEINMMGIPQKVSGLQGITYDYDIKSVDNGKSMMMDVVISAIQMKQQTPVMNLQYDSENPENNEPKDALAMLDELVGTRMSVQLDSSGAVANQKGIDDMLERMTKANPQLAQMKDLLKSQMNVNNTANMLNGFYPKQVVKVGDSWTRTDTVYAQLIMISTKTYTLQERSKKQSIIRFEGDVVIGEESEMELQGMKITYDMSGKTKGMITANSKSGLATKIDEQMLLNGKMKIVGGPMGNMDTDMSIETNSVTEKIR